MAFASVVIDVVDKASSKLKKVNDASKKLSRSFNVLEKRNKGITRGFKGLAKVVAAVGLVEFGRRSVATAANFQKLELRLKLLTEATGQFSDAQKIATKGQELFGISATEALDGVKAVITSKDVVNFPLDTPVMLGSSEPPCTEKESPQNGTSKTTPFRKQRCCWR